MVRRSAGCVGGVVVTYIMHSGKKIKLFYRQQKKKTHRISHALQRRGGCAEKNIVTCI